MPRRGAGYFDPREGDRAPHVLYFRRIFLTRVERIAPEVLTSLRSDVLPLFAQWAAATAEHAECGQALSWWRQGAFDALGLLTDWPGLPELAAALDRWARRWHLADRWLLAITRKTLDQWHHIPELRRFAGDGTALWMHELPIQPLRPFLLTVETWQAFEQRATEWIRLNREAAPRYAAEHGLEPSPEKRTKDPGLHFEWLARYQCQGWTFQRIANHYERTGVDSDVLTRQAVGKATRDTAALIGLTLRET